MMVLTTRSTLTTVLASRLSSSLSTTFWASLLPQLSSRGTILAESRITGSQSPPPPEPPLSSESELVTVRPCYGRRHRTPVHSLVDTPTYKRFIPTRILASLARWLAKPEANLIG